VGDDREVLQAHNQAVTAALRYVEATTAQARIKQDGQTTIETTGNWTIARFNHDASREDLTPSTPMLAGQFGERMPLA
jgi:conjugative relaxase-like TrwC/TraI family protein